MASEVYDLYIRVLTPVHVGIDKSHDLAAGLDFKVENGVLKIYDHKKIIEKVGDVNQYCNALEQGKTGVKRLFSNRHINVDEIMSTEFEVGGSPGELKRQIREGMNGHALLPGSSIKGALTSVLFSHLRNNQRNVNPVLGNFHSSLNRFMHCTDVSFERLAAYNAKIFNLQGNNPNNLRGGWKHGFDNTNINFDHTGFTFAYETIRPGYSAPFTLRFDKNMYQKNLEQLPQSVRGFLQDSDFRKELFTILYGHSAAYLEREIAFFTTFNQAQHSDKLLDCVQKINEMHTPEAPVFRLASGSGFHSITGDWQFDSHNINGIRVNHGRSRGQLNGIDSAKSRRFAFDNVKGQWQFYPMGFVQIMTKEYYEEHCAEKENALVQQDAENRRQRQIAREQRIEKERQREKEANQPQWQDRNYLSQNRPRPIDAIVSGQSKRMMQIRPCVRGFEDEILEIRYPAGMENGTIITVNAHLVGNKIQLQGALKLR